MSIKLSEIQKNKRTCTMEFGGETAKVVYRPAAMTPESEDEFKTALESGRSGDALAGMLANMLVEWDVLGEDDKPISVEYQVLRTVHTAILDAAIKAIMDDVRVSREERKN